MLARRAQKESSLTSLLLVDGVFHCDQLCLPALSVELIRYHLFLVRKNSCIITFFIQSYNLSIILIANVATLTCYIINVCSASSSISPTSAHTHYQQAEYIPSGSSEAEMLVIVYALNIHCEFIGILTRIIIPTV